jgi:hypothetical protein
LIAAPSGASVASGVGGEASPSPIGEVSGRCASSAGPSVGDAPAGEASSDNGAMPLTLVPQAAIVSAEVANAASEAKARWSKVRLSIAFPSVPCCMLSGHAPSWSPFLSARGLSGEPPTLAEVSDAKQEKADGVWEMRGRVRRSPA